jgi:hypothetical protein
MASSAFPFTEKMMSFWQKLLDFIRNEPAAFGGVVSGLIQAIIGVLVAFNVNLTPEQQQAVIGLTTALVSMTVIVSIIVRQNVTPTFNPRDDEGNKLTPDLAPEIATE